MAERERALEVLGLNRLFGGCYDGCRVLITGHTGFKGSWLALWLLSLGAEVSGLALDPDTEPAHWTLLNLRLAHDFRIDLRDGARVRAAMTQFQPQVVFHLAAQPLVRRGYREPVATFETNINGLVNLLESVRVCPSVQVVVNATTDKVYKVHDTPTGYRESDPLGGYDPYSASKACSELISTCYQHSYFDHDDSRGHRVLLSTARAGNVIGGGDWAEDRLVPDLVRAAVSNKPLRLRNHQSTRPWQHVLEPLSGYLRLGEALLKGEVMAEAWNFGPLATNKLTVGEMVTRFKHFWPQLRVEQDTGWHPHETAQLALDAEKSYRELQWRPVWNSDITLRRTAEWYRDYIEYGRLLSSEDLTAYIEAARVTGIKWAA